MAATTASPAASGRIVPARKFQAEVSMSVVANSEPEFHPCIICTTPEAESKKNAAMIGISLATTTFVTKPLNPDSTLATQALERFPPCGGIEIPCAANHERN